MNIEKENYFIKLPNNLVWVNKNKKEEGEISLISKMNSKTVMILSQLAFIKNPLGECRFTLENLITDLGYKPRTGKGNINEQFKEILCNLEKLGFIYNSNISMKDIKLSTFVNCRVNRNVEIDEEGKEINFFSLSYDKFEKIINTNNVDNNILLNIYCYINSRIYHRPENNKSTSYGMRTGGSAESCYFTYEEAIKDLNIATKTLSDYLSVLKENELIYFDNIGYVKKDSSVSIANNVYCIREEELSLALNDSKYYYEKKGYKVLGKDVDLKKNKVSGLKSKIKQMDKKGKDITRLKEDLNLLQNEIDLNGRTEKELRDDIKELFNKIENIIGKEKLIESKEEFKEANYQSLKDANGLELLLNTERHFKAEYRRICKAKKEETKPKDQPIKEVNYDEYDDYQLELQQDYKEYIYEQFGGLEQLHKQLFA